MSSGIGVMGTFKKVLKLEVVWCKTNTWFLIQVCSTTKDWNSQA